MTYPPPPIPPPDTDSWSAETSEEKRSRRRWNILFGIMFLIIIAVFVNGMSSIR